MQKELTTVCLLGFVLLFTVSATTSLLAQDSVEPGVSSGLAAEPGMAAELPALQVIRFSGVLPATNAGPQGVTFALYRDQEGGAPLWLEQQNVQADVQGRYTVLLGSTQPGGLPLALFTGGEARWLGVQSGSEPEQPRVLLVSVPYALKAADAETLGGKPLSAFVLADASRDANPSRDRQGAVASDSPDGPQSFSKTAAVVTPAVTFGTPNTMGKFDVDGVSVVNSSVREEPNAASANLIGGFSGNVVTPGVIGAVIGGGGIASNTNRVTDHFGVVGGGLNNQAGDAAGTTADRTVATVGGGARNTASGLGATVGGGVSNNGSGSLATVGGGFGNTAGGTNATVGGGAGNAASGDNATVPGGSANAAAGGFSFAAGRRAKANHAGTFVWGDSTDADFASTLENQFLIRAGSGVGIGTDAPGFQLDVQNGQINASGGLCMAGDCRTNWAALQSITGNFSITGGNLALPPTADANSGVLTQGGLRIFHSFGSANTFVGQNAGNFSTTGAGSNTAIGVNALNANTTGAQNTATGAGALLSNTTGINNTASGYLALQSNSTGFNNTASGAFALRANTTGNNNTANGEFALESNTTGSQNTATGKSALSHNTTGSFNTASGTGALNANTTGDSNTALGDGALLSNTTGNSNTATGTSVLSSNTTGSNNTASGSFALNSNTTGSSNTASGTGALAANTTGNNNTASGVGALNSNTTGFDNTASGVGALSANTTGDFNTASGRNTLFHNTTGNKNAATGALALQLNTIGFNNTAAGFNALGSNDTGNNNTALGRAAGVTATPANANVSGSENTFLGYQAGPGTPAQLTNATAIGANAVVSADNSLVLGSIAGVNGALSSVNVGIGTAAPTARLDVVGDVRLTGTPGVEGIIFPDGSKQTAAATGGGGPATDVNCAAPCIATLEIEDAAVTGAKLALGSVDSGTVADGTLVDADISAAAAINPTKIAGIAATLGSNAFLGTQSITGGNLALPATADANSGVLTLGGSRFLHGFGPLNTFVGRNAGNFTMSGDGVNTAIGSGALSANTTGRNNTASGSGALASNTSGGFNTATGAENLVFNTIGSQNTASGAGALFSNTTGNRNTANGAGALIDNSSGSFNTALGYDAGGSLPNINTTGSNNTFLGYRAGPGTPTQLTNATAIGSNAVVSADNSLVLGSIAGVNGATSGVNVGIGTAAPAAKLEVVGDVRLTGTPGVEGIIFPDGSKQTVAATGGGGPATDVNCATPCISTEEIVDAAVTGAKLAAGSVDSAKVADGTLVDADISAGAAINPAKIAGIAATLGSNSFLGTQSIAAGNLALPLTADPDNGVLTLGGNRFLHSFGSSNTFLGTNAGNLTMTGSDNTATGAGALFFNTTGTSNTANGRGALQDNTTGSNNTASGTEAMLFNTTGSNNTANGYIALSSNTVGGSNTATGAGALGANVTGSNNTADGWSALRNNVNGFQNTAIGDNALFANSSGHNNSATGASSLRSNTTGTFNTSVGSALQNNTTGSFNTAVGYEAGGIPTTLSINITGSRNTFLGYQAGPGTSTQLTNATAVGANAAVAVDDALVLGSIAGLNGATSNVNVGIGTATPGNILTIVQNSGTDPIADSWTTYSSRRWKTNIRTLQDPLGKVERLRGVSYEWKETGQRDIGLIAEEVGEVVPEVVAYEDNGVDAKSVDYARLTALLIEAIKEQQAQIRELRSKVAALEAQAGTVVTSAR